MSEERGYGVGGLFFAFLAGGLIGAGLALLYAPVSGKEARKKIGDLAGDVKRKAEGMAGDVKRKAEGLAGDVKGRVESFVDEEKSVIKAAYEAGREAMDKERARFTKGD